MFWTLPEPRKPSTTFGPPFVATINDTTEIYDPASRTWAPAGTMTHQHGTSSSLANTHDAVVLSADPRTFRFGAACGGNRGKVLVLGDNLVDPVADLYTPTAPVPTQKDQCVNGGWTGRSTAAYEPFANQGQRIKSFKRGRQEGGVAPAT